MSSDTRRGHRVTGRLGILAGVALAALAAAALAFAGGSASFADVAGDSGSGPDITNVQVSNDDSGKVTFAVTFANRPSPAADLLLAVFVDSDRNVQTGSRDLNGADFLLVSDGGDAAVGTWNGSDWGPTTASAVASYAAGMLRVTVAAADLGKTSGFHFVIGAFEGQDEEKVDLAPDRGIWSYTVATAPLRLTAGAVALQPARPVSGRALSASIAVRRSDTGGALTQGTVTCRLTLDGRPLAARGRLAGGRATCSARLPRGAAGKVLRGTVTAKSGAASVTKTFSTRISR